MKYIFSEMGEGFVETEKKFVPHEFTSVYTKGTATSATAVSHGLLQHSHPKVVSILHQSSCTNVMLFDFLEAKSRVCPRQRPVFMMRPRRLEYSIQWQELYFDVQLI